MRRYRALVDLPLVTVRLLLREWTQDDVDAAYALLGDAATMGRMRSGRADSRDDAAVWVSRRMEQQAEHGLTMWAVERRIHSGVIAACGLFPHDDGLELGYIVDHRHVGNGYATEAARAVCDAARNERPDERIFATIRPHNAGSIRVAENLGFRLGGEVTDEAGALLVYEL